MPEHTQEAQDQDIDTALADLDSMGDVRDDEIEEIDAAAIEEIEEVEEEQNDSEETQEAGADDDADDDADETQEAGTDDTVSDEDLADLEMQIDKEEAYASQTSADIDTEPQGTVAKKPKKAAGGGGTRASVDIDSLDAKHFVLKGDPASMDQTQIDQAKADVLKSKPAQKKVAEKFVNTFQSMAAGKAPSKYVVQAMEHLDAAGGTTDTAALVAAFKASGLGDGTARSQTGQIMVLFPVLGIAKRSGKTLTACDDSNVAAYVRTFFKTPAS
jgi:hypothetical protein